MIGEDDLELVRWAVKYAYGELDDKDKERVSDRVAAGRIGVVEATAKRWREAIEKGKEKDLGKLREPTRSNLLSKRKAVGGLNVDLTALDQWGLARARAIEKLADLLEKDREVLEMRARAALNATQAALLEAEKAPHRGAVREFSSDQMDMLYRIAEYLKTAASGVAGAEEKMSEKSKPGDSRR